MRHAIKNLFTPFLQKAFLFWLRKPRKYSYKDISVTVEPGVFPPFFTFSTKILLEFIETLPLKEKRFLELGCGSGIISILAARRNAKVTASDINETALASLSQNAQKNGVLIEIVKSDLFENLKLRKFDIIMINPPYYPKNPGSISEHAWFCGESFDYFENLFAALPDYLSVENQTFVILSEDCEIETIKAIAFKNNITFEIRLEKKMSGEFNYIYRLIRRISL